VKALRLFLRLIITVLTISLVIVILAGSFWYMWQDSKGKTPEIGYEITARKLEHAALGLYLRYRGEDVTALANPTDASEVPFVIESGETVSTVAYHLQRMGLITDRELFRRIVQYEDVGGGIQAGVYSLRPNMTMEEIMRELQHGRMPSVTITIPEGWRVEQIGALLQEVEIVSAQEFMRAADQARTTYAFLQDRPPGSPAGVRGFLFPDTYQLPQETTAQRVVDIMVQNWDRRIPDELLEKATEQDMSLYEIVTLASIVEREVVREDERALVAGVYLNRLKKGMYLQSDPTVQYAKGYSEETGKWWNPMVQEEAITVISPYNTFLNPGLPPGPICNPGLASIRAVIEPEPSEYLFFYHKGDGSHAFAGRLCRMIN